MYLFINFQCPGGMHKLKFKFKPGTMPRFGPEYTTCIGGCDAIFNDIMEIRLCNVRRTERPNDSGYSSNQSSQRSLMASQNNQNSQRNTIPTNRTNISRAASQVRPDLPSQNAISRPQSRPVENARIQNGWSNQTRTNQNTQSQALRNNQTSGPRNVGMGAYSSNNVLNNSMNQNWGNVDDGSTILCHCHDNAVLLTVRKDGPNQGILDRILFTIHQYY